MFYSQAGQDEWVYDLVGDKGVFVDVGAYDGIQTSNTYFLEQKGWTGICIEANADVFKILERNRKAINVNMAVTYHKGFCTFGNDSIGGNKLVECDLLDNILADNNISKQIDYLSLDIEGHELTVLTHFDFDTWKVRLMTVEHNLYLEGTERKNKIFDLLSARGFTRVKEDVKCLDTNPLYYLQPYEDWYENTFYNSKI